MQVRSFVIVTRSGTRSDTGTLDDLAVFARKVLWQNLALGWWGLPFGLVWTPVALYRNSKALRKLRQLAASGAAAPGWFPDPTGHHGARYWDGAAWTDRVTDVGSDPVAPPPPDSF